MIQFNLLPDVKLEYAKSQRTRRVVFVVAFMATATSLTLLVLMFMVVNVFQKQHIKAVNDDIKSNVKKLEDIPDLDKILTVQNQLTSLTCSNATDLATKLCLHDKKPVSSRLFDYLAKVVPKGINISELQADFDLNTVKFTGTAKTLGEVNKFVDTLKFTQYKLDNGTSANAFSDVVLTSFDKAEGGINFVIDSKNESAIFNSQYKVSLQVPSNKITTRSALDKPSDIFKEQLKPLNSQDTGTN